MSEKKAKIKSLGRLIVNNYPDEMKILNQVYDVEEHDKTYRILKKTSENHMDDKYYTLEVFSFASVFGLFMNYVLLECHCF